MWRFIVERLRSGASPGGPPPRQVPGEAGRGLKDIDPRHEQFLGHRDDDIKDPRIVRTVPDLDAAQGL
jgi:hypothetical protein